MPETLDPNAVAVVVAALQAELATWTYDGFEVGSRITTAQYQTAAKVAIQAYLDFTTAPRI
jgi:hypothetical protein